MDDRVDRDLRRRRLGMRLIAHQARTQTITEFAGLTRHQVATLRRRIAVAQETRYRGPAPTAVEIFFTSSRTRTEASALAVLYCILCDVQPARDRRVAGATSSRSARESRSRRPGGDGLDVVERGERLCDAYEAWLAYFPGLPLEFEQLMLLGSSIARGEQVLLQSCMHCQATILVDPFAVQRRVCLFCMRASRGIDDMDTEPPSDMMHDLALYQLQLLGGQVLRHDGKLSR
jgi:hypothetical protein